MSSRESVERIVSLVALGGGAILLSSCAESKLVSEGVDQEAHIALQRYKPLIGESAFTKVDAIDYASKLEYRSKVLWGSNIDFYMEAGYETPDPSQLDAVAGFVKMKVKKYKYVSWQPRSKDYFVSTSFQTATSRYSAFGLARPYDDLSKANMLDYVYLEFCQGLLLADNDFFEIGIDTQEALCNEVGIAAHSARSGVSYEDYLAAYGDLQFPQRGRTVKRAPFTPSEYDFFRGVFGSEKIGMTQELNELSVSVALTTYDGRRDPAFIKDYLAGLGTKGFVPSEFPAALEALDYFTQEASAGNFV
jgi:hypothetical protein